MKLTNRIYLALVFNSVLLLLIGAVTASAQTDKLPPSIKTTGEATVVVQPDRAQIDVGVVTESTNSQTAVSQNAEKVTATLAALRQLLGADADIKTISYSVTPKYQYPRDGGEATLTGYTATNIVRVTLDDLAKVGSVIDTASQSGSNRINGLRFILKDEAPVQAQALRQAAVSARSKAQSLASALDLKVVRILTLEESSSPVYPVRDVAFARAESSSTPIEAGTIEIKASVTLTVEISQ
jgi:uncharacterized protein YggE